MGGCGGRPPAPFVALLLRAPAPVFHMVEDPVPYDEESRDDDVGQETGAEEHAGEDEFVVHHLTPHASAGTLSAQVSIRVRIPSSS